MDFDGRELTRFYLEKQDLNELLEVNMTLQFNEKFYLKSKLNNFRCRK